MDPSILSSLKILYQRLIARFIKASYAWTYNPTPYNRPESNKLSYFPQNSLQLQVVRILVLKVEEMTSKLIAQCHAK